MSDTYHMIAVPNSELHQLEDKVKELEDRLSSQALLCRMLGDQVDGLTRSVEILAKMVNCSELLKMAMKA